MEPDGTEQCTTFAAADCTTSESVVGEPEMVPGSGMLVITVGAWIAMQKLEILAAESCQMFRRKRK